MFFKSVTSVDVNPCDSTWHYFNKTGCCYKTSSDLGTWFDGSGICAKMHVGAHLASLRTNEESKFVAKAHRNGLDGIHAWTGLSQTQNANNWTFTDGSKAWSSFVAPYIFPHNHTSCVEIMDNWLVELFNNTGKTQPIFCYHLRKSLCKYCPAPPVAITTTVRTPAARIEKAHPRSNQVEMVSGCSSGFNQQSGQTAVKVASNSTTPSPIRNNNVQKTTVKPSTTVGKITLPTTKTTLKPGIFPGLPIGSSINNSTRSL